MTARPRGRVGPGVHLDRGTRAELRRALLDTEPWIDETEVGPRSVDAGACDRCGALPRLLPTCGPVPWHALCRDCAVVVADDGWCEGHAEEGREARAWADRLPSHWHLVVTLWWVSTGEARLDSLARGELAALPPDVRRALGRAAPEG